MNLFKYDFIHGILDITCFLKALIGHQGQSWTKCKESWLSKKQVGPSIKKVGPSRKLSIKLHKESWVK